MSIRVYPMAPSCKSGPKAQRLEVRLICRDSSAERSTGGLGQGIAAGRGPGTASRLMRGNPELPQTSKLIDIDHLKFEKIILVLIQF